MRMTHWSGMFSHLYLLIPKYFPPCFLFQVDGQLHTTFFFSLPLFLISFFSLTTFLPLCSLWSCVLSLNLLFSNPISSLSFFSLFGLTVSKVCSFSWNSLPFPPLSWHSGSLLFLISSRLIPNVFTDLWAKRQNPQGPLFMPTQWKQQLSLLSKCLVKQINGEELCQWKFMYICLKVYLRCTTMFKQLSLVCRGVLGYFSGREENWAESFA